ncbi:MAG: riboflavin kinase [bacterium]|jgi:riboflavin kinase / FMN adenylyltransferase|nr:riboflavin kinase [bacterium]
MQVTFRGRVEKGEGMATGLGCPTANIAIEQGVVIPGLGVYVGEATMDGERYPSLVCVSDGRTGYNLKMEVHLLGENKDLINKRMEVNLLKKMRDIVPYESKEQMTELISQDISEAKQWFSEQAD